MANKLTDSKLIELADEALVQLVSVGGPEKLSHYKYLVSLMAARNLLFP